MNAPIKSLLVIFVLGSPIAVVVFLKFFGSNQFELPVFHQNGPEWEREHCEYAAGQHFVSFPSEITEILPKDTSLVLVGNYQEGNNALVASINRVSGAIENLPLNILLVSSIDHVISDLSERISTVSLSDNEIQLFNDCQLLLANRFQFVLIDQENRIRGYYDLSDNEETERLIVEIKVMYHDAE